MEPGLMLGGITPTLFITVVAGLVMLLWLGLAAAMLDPGMELPGAECPG